jgi:hypothetical protein
MKMPTMDTYHKLNYLRAGYFSKRWFPEAISANAQGCWPFMEVLLAPSDLSLFRDGAWNPGM